MSQTDLLPVRPHERVIGFESLFGATAVSTLIGSQIFTVAAATVYSLVVLLHLSRPLTIGFTVVFGAVALWATIIVVRLAFDAETDPVNNERI